MYYEFDITVPANTAEATPIEQIMALTEGVITYAEIQFPRGTYDLVHCRVFDREFQIWPINRPGYLSSDGYVVPIPDTHELVTTPYELKIKAWSLADTYDYVIKVRITVQRPGEMEKISPLGKALNKFLQLVGMGG